MSNAAATKIWHRFCERFNIVKDCVALFEITDAGNVSTRSIGRGATARPVLVRSQAMETMVLNEVAKLADDWTDKRHRLDGMIYVMGWKKQDQFVPLYIGKTESFGKGAGNLSANIKNLKTDRSKFARWGDNYAYHIGDLSACLLPGHGLEKRTTKYSAWSQRLFEEVPSSSPRLRQEVFFWARAWNPSHVGVWEELGPTSLAFLEYLLIGVAGLASPQLLNREGNARSAPPTSDTSEEDFVRQN